MQVDDKVICTEADYGGKLEFGREYTVRSVTSSGDITLTEVRGLWFRKRFSPSIVKKAPDATIKDSNPKDAGTLGRKDDSGKIRMELLNDMPRAIMGVAEVLHWAVTDKKPTPYVPGSWQHVDNYYARYTGALMRHQNNIATHGQFAKDAETDLLDLKHLACDILILLELTLREQESKA